MVGTIPHPYRIAERKHYNKYVKRAFDITVASILGLGLLSWIYPLMYILIKTGSRGPLLFRQKRIGYRGQEFNCIKFRTMYVNEQSDTLEASKNDRRITPIGRFLRKTCLDELPQLLNVLMGDMSIVGPRPHMISHHKRFASTLHNYDARHYVKPGITGLAQVKGYHGTIMDFRCLHGRTRLDLFYVKKASLGLDIKILMGTIPVIFRLKSF